MTDEKRCSIKGVLIVRDVADQSVEDMELNAESYIKDDIEMKELYIEDIIKIKE